MFERLEPFVEKIKMYIYIYIYISIFEDFGEEVILCLTIFPKMVPWGIRLRHIGFMVLPEKQIQKIQSGECLKD